jgi:hypothetical protein
MPGFPGGFFDILKIPVASDTEHRTRLSISKDQSLSSAFPRERLKCARTHLRRLISRLHSAVQWESAILRNASAHQGPVLFCIMPVLSICSSFSYPPVRLQLLRGRIADKTPNHFDDPPRKNFYAFRAQRSEVRGTPILIAGHRRSGVFPPNFAYEPVRQRINHRTHR